MRHTSSRLKKQVRL